MVNIEIFRKLALAFEEAEELPHFEKTSFRVNKKIFATLNPKNGQVVVKFSLIDQSVFCAIDPLIIYPVPGKWGLQGWTMIDLKKVHKALLAEALTTSYRTVAPKRLAEKYKSGD